MATNADVSYQPKVYLTPGGDELRVKSGGNVELETGATLKFNGVNQTAALATAPAGVAAGYKIARGEGTLDGSNPTTIATGLTTVVAFTATLKGTTSPSETATLTANISGANVDVYAWAHTTGGAAGNPTLIASGSTFPFYWIAIGT